jgi:hypothetical protein
MNRFGLSEERLHFIEWDHAGGITECLAWVRMGLEEEAVATYSYCCPGEMGNKLGTSSSWIFTRNTVISDHMCGIKDDGASDFLQDGNGAEV